MKVGFIQFSPIIGKLDLTLQRLDYLLKEGQEADLLVLPELCNSGYAFESKEQAISLGESSCDSRFIEFLHKKSIEYQLHIVSGFCEKENENLYNSSILIGPKGNLGIYRKSHLFLNEKDYFKPGNTDYFVVDIGICKIGMLICFDWVFPEAWRILALKGADIICHPSNIVLPGLCQKTIPGHSICNRIFIVTANRIGTEGELTFTGSSIICDPRGSVLSQASNKQEEVRLTDIDLNLSRDKSITSRNHIFLDRRLDKYLDILKAIDEYSTSISEK